MKSAMPRRYGTTTLERHTRSLVQSQTRKELCPNADKPEITVAVVSPTAQVDTAGKYHIDGLFYVAPEEILMLAADTIEKLRNLRLKYGAKEYSECVNDF